MVDDFVIAADAADTAKMITLLCPEEAAGLTQDEDPEQPQTASEPPPVSSATDPDPCVGLRFNSVEIRDEVAAVKVTRADQAPFVLHLRREGGSWKMCAPAEHQFRQKAGQG